MSVAQKSILLVEDDQAIRESLREILNDFGYPVQVAENGKIALDFLRQADVLPALILLDLMMPVMDGYEFRTVQLADPKLAEIPTIAVSASGNLQEKADNLRVTDYLKKPIDLEMLFSLIEHYFSTPPAKASA
jgi:CheY-like chemotaxis protein